MTVSGTDIRFLDAGIADVAVKVAIFRFTPVQGPTGRKVYGK